ncbi:MerR family transcriptional regulator [Deinococcus maricopensis]|uniref:Transcriptional regulator, MerR family n=1 Tax=Deinococcus maricopensis (strain DSM 21211 / LMG 22137 / NRRL B-23946 / LB-34) TaxID=709986 RepID=E8U9U5_DEIML|nr:MerR family transcriptional regulator [Deinococcus maricopensis]ADV67834.1 transcriptional regulator, MerR family [Deinococcus maricopensis DSM 21211]
MNEQAVLHEQLTISAFARESRLTVKALRLYDALGLLHPAIKDPSSHYRYYTRAQLRRARLIGLLRQLDMPLTHIAAMLHLDAPGAVGSLRAYWADQEQQHADQRNLVQYLAGYLLGEGASMYTVTVRDVPQQQVLTVQRTLFAAELPAYIEAAERALFERLARAGQAQSGPAFVIYHGQVNEDSDGPVEVCVPFDGAIAPEGEQRLRLEGAHREAFTTITLAQCAFPEILNAYDAVHAWMMAQGLRPVGAPREVYFTSPAGLAPDDAFCDVAWPVQ